MKKRKILYGILIIISIIALLIALPPTRSMAVMSVYSAMESKESVMHENNFVIKVPSSSGWYPFAITFNPVNFGKWSYTGADMSIIYNFARFRLSTLSSDIFNPQSDMNSSFYGAYALHQAEGYFGYYGDEINIDDIILTFEYDYKFLVLQDLGCEDLVFKPVEFEIADNLEYVGYDGWTKIDAVIETNSMLHNYSENHMSYMQYGKPKTAVEKDFAVTKMYGRLYIRAFEEYNSTIIIYVMSPSTEVIENCDNEILRNTKIHDIN